MRPQDVTVIGAGPSGLAVAGCLKQRGISALILDAQDTVASAWRNHYDRLHLHTPKGSSSLPGLPFPSSYPRYPSRDQLISYLEAYARHFSIDVALGERVTRVSQSGAGWAIVTERREVPSRHVVVATGYTRVPKTVDWPGLASFRGEVLHSSRYRNGEAFREKRVLVVGFGNSGGEIAIDLHEHGAHPTIAVRSRVNVLPLQLLGAPILSVGAVFRSFPPRLADLLAAPLLALSIGDVEKLGLRKQAYGPLEQIHRDGRIPLIDVGTLALVRSGKIKIAAGIDRFTEATAVFEGGATEPFDAVVLATGYRPELVELLPAAAELCDANGFPRPDARPPAGLHLCGFNLSTRGMLNEINHEARQIAREIAADTAPRAAA